MLPQFSDNRKNAWFPDLSNDVYHSDKTAVSSTGLRKILKSPRAFYDFHTKAYEIEETDALRFGSAVHMALLEPKEFEKFFVQMPKFSGVGSVTKREQWKEGLKPGAVVLKDDEYADLQGMLNSVLKHPDACNILKTGKRELSGYYTDPETGILCRIRPDFFHEAWMVMMDLKTTKNVESSEFAKSIWNFRYDFQFAMYSYGIEQITGKKVEYPLALAIEKGAPYECAVFMLDDAGMNKGLTDYMEAMRKLKACLISNEWAGYQSKIQPISLPAWAYKESLL